MSGGAGGAGGRRVLLGAMPTHPPQTPAGLLTEQNLNCTFHPVQPQMKVFSPVIKRSFPQWPSPAESHIWWEGTLVSQPGMYGWSLWMSQRPQGQGLGVFKDPLGWFLTSSPDQEALENV